MNCVLKLLFLFLTLNRTQGSELTINVRKNDCVTLVCSSDEVLGKCYCPSYPQKCNTCTVVSQTSFHEIYRGNSEKHFKMRGLQQNNSGLYVCYTSYSRTLGKQYRINVFDDRDPTVVVGTVGQPIVLSCGTELDTTAASEKHWCRLADGNSCQPNTAVGPEIETGGDFKILDGHGSFSLKKNQLEHVDAGLYRCTLSFQNMTKSCEVELQVKDKLDFLQINPVQITPKPGEQFELSCVYSQDLQEFPKSWLCNYAECPETVRRIDDRFQSALLLTIDHVACSDIDTFQCVVKKSENLVYSNIYRKPFNQNLVVNYSIREHSFVKTKIVKVEAYIMLNLICYKSEVHNWEPASQGGRIDNFYYDYAHWCRVIRSQCLTEQVKETVNSVILEICVTPDHNGARYRCASSWRTTDIQIIVRAPTPPGPMKPIPPQHSPPRSNSGTERSVGIIIVLVVVVVVIIMLSVTVRCKGQSVRERLFTRRTPLSEVDIHANMYANSVADYYSHHHSHQVPSAGEQGEGDNKETSSSSEDEFEDLSGRPKSSSFGPEKYDYVRVKPGGVASAADNCINMSGVSTKDEAGNTSNTGGVARSSSVQDNILEDDEEDEVTYTHVIIKPKVGSQ